MIKKIFFLTTISLQLFAQNSNQLQILQKFDSSAPEFQFGNRWTTDNQPGLGNGLDPIYSSLYYGKNFIFRKDLPPGIYSITLLFLEPNATAPGQRKFTYSINGNQSQPIDLSNLVGQRTYETSQFVNIESTLTINFQSTIGNAVVSGVFVRLWMPTAAGN